MRRQSDSRRETGRPGGTGRPVRSTESHPSSARSLYIGGSSSGALLFAGLCGPWSAGCTGRSDGTGRFSDATSGSPPQPPSSGHRFCREDGGQGAEHGGGYSAPSAYPWLAIAQAAGRHVRVLATRSRGGLHDRRRFLPAGRAASGAVMRLSAWHVFGKQRRRSEHERS